MSRASIITRHAAEALRRYQYHGSDNSLLYKYILSPLAESCMCFLPTWMAPNLVTTIGLSFTTASYVLLYLTAPGIRTENTPAWVFPTAALGLFLYQTLDNMDGKQARRTKSSSPLGLIFDHGCDAINCGFGIVFAACILNAGTSLPMLAAVILNQVTPFFTTTWEHYYTDSMVLPIVNGPSEGVLLGIFAACLRGYFGVEFFDSPREELWGKTYGMVLIGFSLAGVVLTALKQLFTVSRVRAKIRRSMAGPVEDMLGFVILLAASGCWAWRRSSVLMGMPYAVILMICIVFVDINVHIMVCHVCNLRCRPLRPLLFPFIMVVGNSLVPGGPLLDEAWLVWIFNLLAFLYECVFLYIVVQETSTALNIFVFKLGRPGGKDVSKTS